MTKIKYGLWLWCSVSDDNDADFHVTGIRFATSVEVYLNFAHGLKLHLVFIFHFYNRNLKWNQVRTFHLFVKVQLYSNYCFEILMKRGYILGYTPVPVIYGFHSYTHDPYITGTALSGIAKLFDFPNPIKCKPLVSSERVHTK
ncbi:hypothetical protein D3C71_1517450 [compost metagenome]